MVCVVKISFLNIIRSPVQIANFGKYIAFKHSMHRTFFSVIIACKKIRKPFSFNCNVQDGLIQLLVILTCEIYCRAEKRNKWFHYIQMLSKVFNSMDTNMLNW